jgi:hypothetical protein
MRFIDNKYSKMYFNIINCAKNRCHYVGYTEKHHIIPKSLGGSNNKDNLVKLSAKEHFICHLLLTKFLFGEDKAKMVFGAKRMMIRGNQHQNNRYVPSSRIYEMIKKEEAIILSEKMKFNIPMSRDEVKIKHAASIKKRGKSPGMTGQSHSLETRHKMSQRTLRQSHSLETRKKLKEHFSIPFQSPDGTIYPSRKEAAIAYNVTPGCIRNWVVNGTKGWRKLEK